MHTKTPWHRDGWTLYALQPVRNPRKGWPEMENRWSLHMQRAFTGCTDEEAMACLRLMHAASESYDRAFGPAAVEAAEGDLMGQMVEVLRGHESPQLWRLEWLSTLVNEIGAGTLNQSRDEDPDAYWEMLTEARVLVDRLRTILARIPTETRHVD